MIWELACESANIMDKTSRQSQYCSLEVSHLDRKGMRQELSSFDQSLQGAKDLNVVRLVPAVALAEVFSREEKTSAVEEVVPSGVKLGSTANKACKLLKQSVRSVCLGHDAPL